MCKEGQGVGGTYMSWSHYLFLDEEAEVQRLAWGLTVAGTWWTPAPHGPWKTLLLATILGILQYLSSPRAEDVQTFWQPR